MSYIGNTVENQNYVPAVDYFNGDGSTTAFTLSRPIASVAAVQAVISNVPQNPGSAFTVSGSTITFTSAPPSGTANIYVYYTSPNTQVVQPGQGTVGTTQMAAGVNFTAGTITFADSSTISSHAAPQVTVYTSGSGTYTTPANCKYLYVQMVGGGGGGGGAGGNTSAGDGGAGGDGGSSSFGTNLSSGGGTHGNGGSWQTGAGGSATLGSITSGIAIAGAIGPVVGQYNTALGAYTGVAVGVPTPLGLYGAGGNGGGVGPTACCPGSAGGTAGYVQATLTSPSATYSYSVGAGGTAGAAGTNGNPGSVGGAGRIIVIAYF